MRVATFALFLIFPLITSFQCSRELSAEIYTYTEINNIRETYGLPDLKADYDLAKIAVSRSEDMASNEYFSHNPPNGCNYICLMTASGVRFSWAGENIAWNNWPWEQSPEVAVEGWKESPPHLENIVNCHYTRFGGGVAQASDGKIYYTMIFEGDNFC